MGENRTTIWYLPEHITHLYFSPVYVTLSARQRLAYNRLHACYHCEICALLEGELPRYYLRAVALPGVPDKLRREAQVLADAERWHATAFRALARSISPSLYASPGRDVFAPLPSALPAVCRRFVELPVFRPALLWIALIQEERGEYFAKEILRLKGQIDNRMVEWQERHLADELDHISLGEELIPLYWEATPSWARYLNQRLLRFLFREFLSVPKRSGLRVIDHLVLECPELLPRKAELMQAMLELGNNPKFHDSIYSRKIVPKTFALFDKYSDFRNMGKGLYGYAWEGSR